MRRPGLLICLLTLLPFFSCIPFKIAPDIDGHKVMMAKKFKKDLPLDYAYVFEDTKDADEFYYFVNSKFDLDFVNVEMNVPVKIEERTYFISFFEREKTTETLNLIPVVIDGMLNSGGIGPIMEDAHSSRNGYWFILLTVLDNDMNDALAPAHSKRDQVVQFLNDLQQEYTNTHHYSELSLKNQLTK